MPELNDTLEAIGKELAGLIKAEEPATEKVMTPEEFVAYAAEQITLAKSDEDPKPRLEHLAGVVDLAKAYSWEDGGGMSVSVYSGPLSVQAGSRQAEKIAEHPGKPCGVDQKASPSTGAFEAASGPTGPASNTARPAARYMPPAFQQSEPAANAEGFLAKAATVLKSVDGGELLLGELAAMLSEDAKAEAVAAGEPTADKGSAEPIAKMDDGWPSDCAAESFLKGEPEIKEDEDFGADPADLGRGKTISE